MPAKKPKRKKVAATAGKKTVRVRRAAVRIKPSATRPLKRPRRVAAKKSPVRKRVVKQPKAKPAVARKKISIRKIAPKKTTKLRIVRQRVAVRTKAAPIVKRIMKRSRVVKPRTKRPVTIAEILSGLADKKIISTSPPPPAAALPKATALPEAYGTERLFLVARDPRWLHAHWDFTREQQQRLNQSAAEGHLTLRIYQDSPTGQLVKEAELRADSRSWFVPVASGATRFVAELGYETPRGGWVSVALSRAVVTPPDTVAPDNSVVFATIPMHVTFAQIMKSLNAPASENQPLVAALQEFHAAGYGGLTAGVFVAAPDHHWSAEQARQLARCLGTESIRRRMRSDLSSLAAAQILPVDDFVWEELPAELELADWSDAPSSPGGGWSGELLCVEA